MFSMTGNSLAQLRDCFTRIQTARANIQQGLAALDQLLAQMLAEGERGIRNEVAGPSVGEYHNGEV